MHTCGTYWLYSPLAPPSPISPRHSAQHCISSISHVFMTHHVQFVLPSHTLGWSTVEHVEPTRRHIHKANGAFFLPTTIICQYEFMSTLVLSCPKHTVLLQSSTTSASYSFSTTSSAVLEPWGRGYRWFVSDWVLYRHFVSIFCLEKNHCINSWPLHKENLMWSECCTNLWV